ncbi:MAG TPA: hypothetical protein DDY34_16085 [Bacteroidales bacterium]|nr:hypothetical protein [Bacteroidales bacterium]
MIDLGPINLFSKQVIKGETWYKITNRNAYRDRNIVFRENKEKDQIRIICLGGSASAGWPHPPDEIFSRYLEKSLQNLYPAKKVEVINCSAHGFASYRVRQVFETIIPLQPDAVIIWCGNNEFLERRNYNTSDLKNFLISIRNNFRSLQIIHQLISKNQFGDTPDVAETFWKKVNEEALELRSDVQQFEMVKAHYRNSIEDIVESAKENNIGLMLMTVPVNLRDWEPNVSYLGLNSADSLRWVKEFRQGKNEFLMKDYPRAVESLLKANTIAPLNAETCYWIAKAYEGMEDSLKALHYYNQAKDLDYNPFRTITDFNNTLRTITSNNSQAVLLDMEELIRPYAHKGIPGFDLFLDYVHPTKTGNLAITREVANKIINSDLISFPPDRQRINFDETREINKSDYSEDNDLYIQFTRFSLCCMTHQYYSALSFGNILKGSIPPELTDSENSQKINLINDAIETFNQYVEFEIESLTRDPLPEEELNVMNNIKSFYQKHFPYGTF